MATLPINLPSLSKSMMTALFVLSTVMLLSGALKLIGTDLFVTQFANFGYPSWFVYAVGFLEILSVAMLWIRSTRGIGALLIGATMIAAAYSHFAAGEFGMLPVNIAIMGVTSFVWINSD